MAPSDKFLNKKVPVGPGPAKYYLPSTVGHHQHDVSRSRGPSFSMGIRLPGLFSDQKLQSPSPGPKYQIEYMTQFGKDNIPRLVNKRSRPRSSAFASVSDMRSSVNMSPRRLMGNKLNSAENINFLGRSKSNFNKNVSLKDNTRSLNASDGSGASLSSRRHEGSPSERRFHSASHQWNNTNRRNHRY